MEDLALAVGVGTQTSVVAVLVEVCFDRDWLDFPCFHTLWTDQIFGRLTEHSLLKDRLCSLNQAIGAQTIALDAEQTREGL